VRSPEIAAAWGRVAQPASNILKGASGRNSSPPSPLVVLAADPVHGDGADLSVGFAAKKGAKLIAHRCRDGVQMLLQDLHLVERQVWGASFSFKQ